MKTNIKCTLVLAIMSFRLNLFADSFSFALMPPAGSLLPEGVRLAHVSIGMLQGIPTQGLSQESYKTYQWQEYVCVTNPPLVHSLNTLLDMGSTNINLASLGGWSYYVMFFEPNESVPRSIAAISRGFSWVTIYSCRQDVPNSLVYAKCVSHQVNPIWVGLVYGTLVRYDFESIQRERNIFSEGTTNQSFEDFMFCESVSEAFEKIWPSITNTNTPVRIMDDAFLTEMTTNHSDFSNSKAHFHFPLED